MFSAVCQGGGFAARGLLGTPFLNSPRDGRRLHIVSWQVAFLLRRSVRRAALMQLSASLGQFSLRAAAARVVCRLSYRGSIAQSTRVIGTCRSTRLAHSYIINISSLIVHCRILSWTLASTPARLLTCLPGLRRPRVRRCASRGSRPPARIVYRESTQRPDSSRIVRNSIRV